ncbi:histidine phosphatase superfamily [Mycena sp. CBHHK59/15]|nr:histidine phosphatase superfamily [Mycena sp. CBHHK59/15]
MVQEPQTSILKSRGGTYTPFFSVDSYIPPPAGCCVNQIQRHGAWYPTSGASKNIISAISKLQSAENYTDSHLDFLKTFEYTLGISDLVPFGAQQSSESGELAFEHYADLIGASNLPFRVIDTANNWTAGFSAASNHVFNPSISVIISEAGNDTLDNNMCLNAGNSDTQTDTWLVVFAPSITTRLNSAAPGANISNDETYSLISMCPFHAVATFVGYSMDLDTFYETRYGAPLGPVQGVGYINELLVRLTGTPVNDTTQTNRTLTQDTCTFPLDRALYADFSHDNEMRMTCTSGKSVHILVNDAVQPLEFCEGAKDGVCELGAFVASQRYAQNGGNGDWDKCFA